MKCQETKREDRQRENLLKVSPELEAMLSPRVIEYIWKLCQDKRCIGASAQTFAIRPSPVQEDGVNITHSYSLPNLRGWHKLQAAQAQPCTVLVIRQGSHYSMEVLDQETSASA